MNAVVLRGFFSRRMRAVLTGIAIALGVALMAGHLHPHRHDRQLVRRDLRHRCARALGRRRAPPGARRNSAGPDGDDQRRDAGEGASRARRRGRRGRGVHDRLDVRRRQASEHPRAELRRLDAAGALRELLLDRRVAADGRGRRRDRPGDRPALLAEARPVAARRRRDRRRHLPDRRHRQVRGQRLVRRRRRRGADAAAGPARRGRARRLGRARCRRRPLGLRTRRSGRGSAPRCRGRSTCAPGSRRPPSRPRTSRTGSASCGRSC